MILPMIMLSVALAGAGTIETESEAPYSEDDLYVLSHIINAECGDENCSHEQRIATGSVVINRVNSDIYPNSVREVVFQSGQYSPTWNGGFDKEPSEDSIAVAELLLTEGSQIPENCLFQAEFPQGSGIYQTFETIYGTTYICYR